MRLIIPDGYKPLIGLKETEKALQLMKDHFESGLSSDLRLRRVTAPLFVLKGTGLNDDLRGVEKPITFPLKDMRGEEAEVVQSLAKWKRMMLRDYDIQIGYGPGYDHNWVLNKEGDELSLTAEVYEPTTGRVMTIHTTEPAIQFYAGNFLDGTIQGKGGKTYAHRYGFCLETQHSPDSPNKPDWPTTILRPGEVYTSTTVHKFSVR